MGVHIAVVGNGRIGRPTAYTIFNERLADELSLVDVKPGQAWAFGEELRHVAASLRYDVEIHTYEEDGDVSGADFVISTGDHPDTLRFRTKLSLDLGVPISKVEGFVGGEHGSAAHCLWSTVSIGGVPIDDYLGSTGKRLDREGVTAYVRGVSKKVVDIIGGTEVGPASGFRDIVRSILQDRGETYSIADSLRLPTMDEAVNVSVPTRVDARIGPNIWSSLTEGERQNIISAARAIQANYRAGLQAVGKE